MWAIHGQEYRTGSTVLVATFDCKEDAMAYITASELKWPKPKRQTSRRSSKYRRVSLLGPYKEAFIEEHDGPALHNPEVTW